MFRGWRTFTELHVSKRVKPERNCSQEHCPDASCATSHQTAACKKSVQDSICSKLQTDIASGWTDFDLTLGPSWFNVVSPADHDERLPETNECFVSPLLLPTTPRGHSLALNASSLTPASANSGWCRSVFSMVSKHVLQ